MYSASDLSISSPKDKYQREGGVEKWDDCMHLDDILRSCIAGRATLLEAQTSLLIGVDRIEHP